MEITKDTPVLSEDIIVDKPVKVEAIYQNREEFAKNSAATVKEIPITLDQYLNGFVLTRAERYYYKHNFNKNELLIRSEWKIITSL